jgi:DNA-binding transcriptional MerR regulator
MGKIEMSLIEMASCLGKHPSTIRYHIRKGNIMPETVIKNNRIAYVFDLLDFERFKEILRED